MALRLVASSWRLTVSGTAWSQNDNDHQPTHEAGTGLDLGLEWYRDVLRAKWYPCDCPGAC
jgi:hypothetical protein